MQDTVPARSDLRGSALPGGSGLVFPATTGIVIADAHAKYERSIDLDLHSISKHASKDTRLAVTAPGS
jgi:hypothetical protein